MYSIPFLREAMEYLLITVCIKIENRSKVMSAARSGYSENDTLLIQGQISIRVCAGLAARETVQNCELARRSYFENRSVVVSSTLICGPTKISRRVLDQSSIGVLTVRATGKAILHTLLPSGRHFEHHTASESATPHRRAIDVAGCVENQSGVGIIAVCTPKG